MAAPDGFQYNGAVFKVKGEDTRIQSYLDDGCLLLGIADGHGGHGAARLCRQELRARTAPLSERDAPPLFAALHDACSSLECCSGTTLTLCVVQPDRRSILCAGVGDSSALVVTPTSHFWLTVSHRLQDNAAERSRLRSAVRFASSPTGKDPVGPPRIYPGGLSNSRAIGDADCPLISCEPSVTWSPFGPSDVLVVASDGLWDDMPLSKICRVARETRCAQHILNVNVRSGAFRDDTSVIVASCLPRVGRTPSPIASLFRNASASSLSSDDDDDIPSRQVVQVKL